MTAVPESAIFAKIDWQIYSSKHWACQLKVVYVKDNYQESAFWVSSLQNGQVRRNYSMVALFKHVYQMDLFTGNSTKGW